MTAINYELLTKPFPAEVIKRRPDGYQYVDSHFVLERLREATGNLFDLRTTFISKDWHEATNYKGEDVSHYLYIVHVALEIDGCHREQFGTSRDFKMEDDAIKAAVTDGLKKCLTLWGVGIEEPEPAAQNRSDQNDQTPRKPDPDPNLMVGPATEPQLKKIQGIRHNGTWKIRTKAWAQCTLGVVERQYTLKAGDPGCLTKGEASKLIKWLLELAPADLQALPLDETTQQAMTMPAAVGPMDDPFAQE